MNTAVYPGSFDPITNGHLDIIRRSAEVFDKVIVGVINNSNKTPSFTLEQRADMVRKVTSDMKNVEVGTFSGLLVDFMKQVNAAVIIKGLRTVADFEYEFQMALLNKTLDPEVETMFMMTNSKYSYISSSMVKEVARWHGSLDEMLPDDIIDIVEAKLKTGV